MKRHLSILIIKKIIADMDTTLKKNVVLKKDNSRTWIQKRQKNVVSKKNNSRTWIQRQKNVVSKKDNSRTWIQRSRFF